MSISSTLINWYLEKKRNLPWRNTPDPYKIWVSEIILQQTRVAQGLDYYYRFLDHFPDIQSLALADMEKVMKVWQGLGYYSRARNMHAAAVYLLEQCNGSFPQTFDELLKIKGIGHYTASAIASFAFNLPHATIDGNVNRFISRFFGLHLPVNSLEGIKAVRDTASKILDKNHPALHNQAIMEFGALQCIPKPDCSICPFKKECYAVQQDIVNLLPVKIKSAKPRNRYFNYYVFVYQNFIHLRKRSEKDIWQGLYDFPLHESARQNTSRITRSFIHDQANYKVINISEVYIHQLSHQTIHARFFLVKLETKPEGFLNDSVMIDRKDLHLFPIPKLIDNYITRMNEKNYFEQIT